jgi:hypothetical protein
MSNHDLVFRLRLRAMPLADDYATSIACRMLSSNRSTYFRHRAA